MKLLILLILLLLSTDVLAAQSISGMVRHVADGDTMTVVTRGAGKLKVRLYGIDAPETRKPDRIGQPYGDQAQRVLKYKLLGREVQLEVRERDQYNRVVAVVRQGNRDINAEMVAEGMAWAYRRYLEGSYASEYIQLEERARRRHQGLWRQSNPQPPWEFRQAVTGHGKRRR